MYLCYVQTLSEQVLQRHMSTVAHASTDNVIAYAKLEQMCCDLCADSRTFQLAVLQLCREGRCVVMDTQQGEKVVMLLVL